MPDVFRVRDHDFLDVALGKVRPCGIYDMTANTSSAPTTMRRVRGGAAAPLVDRRRRPPRRTKLLITADAGGYIYRSAGSRFAERTEGV